MFKMYFMTSTQVAHNSKLVKYNIIDQKKWHQNFYSRNLLELSFKKMVGGVRVHGYTFYLKEFHIISKKRLIL